MKKFIRLLCAVCIAMAAFALSSFGTSLAAQTVKFKICPYYTEIDYMSVYNPAVEYPVLTYKDVTYIPLTGSLANRLGLAIGFDGEKGLFIANYFDSIFYQLPDDKPFGGDGVHWYNVNYNAVIPEYPIYVNGIHYNSFKEEYPFLNYNGITYMPMTYELAVKELGLSVDFREGEGFFLNRSDLRDSYLSVAKNVPGEVIVMNQRVGQMPYANNPERMMTYFWWERYKLYTENDFLEHLGTYHSLAEFYNEYYPTINRDGENENIWFTRDDEGNGILHYKGKPIDTVPNVVDSFGREYIFDNVTFVYFSLRA